MKFRNLIEEKFADIIGQEEVKKQLKSALLTNRNVILVGAPGLGKTTLAKSVAQTMSTVDGQKTPFIRVQGSPDLTAEDLLGDIDPIKALKFGPTSKEAFSPGKIFQANGGMLFFDEVNRCSEKLQNALLQALEEKKVTIGSYKVDFDADFVLIATMNPEDTSTETLSDVFLDRFDFVYVDYPETLAMEHEIVLKSGEKHIEFGEKLLKSVLLFIRKLRMDPNIDKKPSVRASIGMYERAQTHAMLSGKKIVSQKDIQAVLISVLSHRMRLKPSIKYLKTPEKYLQEEYEKFANNDTGGFL